MNELQTILLTSAGWLAPTWFAYRWGLRSNRLARQEESRSAIRASRISFVGFLRSWIVCFSPKNYGISGWQRDYSAFFDTMPKFIHICEHIRADLAPTQRIEFSERIGRIRAKKHKDFYGEKFEELISEVEALISFIEDA
jgi:hypothetical protein